MTELRGVLLLIVPYADAMPWDGEGSPGETEPAIAGGELVGCHSLCFPLIFRVMSLT